MSEVIELIHDDWIESEENLTNINLCEMVAEQIFDDIKEADAKIHRGKGIVITEKDYQKLIEKWVKNNEKEVEGLK